MIEAREANTENTNQDLQDDDQVNSYKQILTFKVADKEYCVDITKVREIKSWVRATRVPNAPEYLRGVVNLRGIVIPIFDLRIRFGMIEDNKLPEPLEEPCIKESRNQSEIQPRKQKNVVIVLAVGDRIIGALVDEVSDILNINQADIKSSPSSSETGIRDEFVDGLLMVGKKMVIYLNTEQLFKSAKKD